MTWQDIVKQKPLDMSPLEAARARRGLEAATAIADEIGSRSRQRVFIKRAKEAAKEAATKMPPHIREGLERAIRWMEENM